jgi:NAD(P)-dependent dehydrogenase (short-subunit alcohol dehydrogenase family)
VRADASLINLWGNAMGIEGKMAVVTGGAEGIGKAIATLFAAHGAKVLIVDVNEVGQAVADEIGGAFRRVDVSKSADMEALGRHVQAEYGQLDIMVNNAGVADPGPLLELSDERFDRIMDINFRGVFHGCRVAGRMMRERGQGAIVNMSSIGGIMPMPGHVIYSTTKAAIICLTKGLAVELAPFGVRVNAICPGLIATTFGAKAGVVAEGLKAVDKLQPIGRMGQTEEIAEGALYLVSDAASFVTGHHLVIDGGMTAGISLEN